MKKVPIRLRSDLLPWIVLAVFIAGVFLQWQSERKLVAQKMDMRFANACDHMIATLSRRLQRYNLLLQGCRGLFNASDIVDRAEFHAYVASLNLDEYCPGAVAAGFCRHVPSEELPAYIERQRSDGSPGFTVFPMQERAAYCPVEFIEPYGSLNTTVLGFDACSEPVRRAALEQSRDRGETVMSARIMLMQSPDDTPQAGILFVAPVYGGHGAEPDSPQERRAALVGYVYVAVRISDYIEAALARLPLDIAFELYDGEIAGSGSLMYRSPNSSAEAGDQNPRFVMQSTIERFGKTWTVRFRALPCFKVEVERTGQVFITVAGLAVGLLLWLATLYVVRSNRRLVFEVGERGQAEAALRRASQGWRTTFDAMLDPVALMGIDARVRQCNRAFADFVGLPFAEIIGRECYVFVHGTNKPPAECPVRRSLKSGQRETWETQLGSRSVVIVADPTRDDSGTINGVVHIIHDITARRQAERQLAARNQELTTILDAIEAFIWISMDPDCRRIVGNRYVNDMVGVKDGTNLSQTASETGQAVRISHINPDGSECPAGELPLQQAVATARPVMNRQFEYRFPGGRSVHVTGNAVPLFDDDGRVRGSVGVFFDITQIKRAEEQLRDIIARQTALLGAIPDIVMETDIDKKYTWANGPGFEFFGPDVLGREAAHYFVGQQGTYAQVDALFRGDEKTVYIESWQRRCDGEERLLAWWCHVLKDADGSVRGALSTARDITEQKMLEQDLSRKNRELEGFVYTVSHDLRSPLITIRTYLGHLAQDVSGGDMDRVRQDIGFIDNAAHAMNTMLEELLQLSRVGRMANPSVENSFLDIAQEAITLVAGQIEQRGVRVRLCEEPIVLYGDRTRLVQVMQNLVDNAVKHMGEQEDPRIEIGARDVSGGGVLVWVRDNGSGIEPGAEEKIFMIFERHDSASSGAGIGLALVKRIIELHGGRVWVESDGPGKGACFKFTLPGKRESDVQR